MRLAIHSLLFLFAGIFCLAMPAMAATGDPAACASLKGTAFADVIDAPTSITSTAYVDAKGEHPAYCAVEGYVTPTNGFALWLPSNWNGKFLVRGCGGFCGVAAGEFACKDPIKLGYACMHADMGHKSTLTDAAWAYNNLQGEVDFGYRGTHVTTLAGKAILARYYAAKAVRNYFLGCSTGGRQAMVSAQRFPKDFDGIISIAPAIRETGAAIQLSWSVLANRNGQSNILTPAKVRMLHKAVIAACDMNDGLRDGLIGDPRQCSFKPSSLACKSGSGEDCLSPAELGVVNKIYAGPSDSRGRPLYPGGLMLGSELNWTPSYIGEGNEPGRYGAMMQEFWRYLGFDSDPGPGWTLDRFDFDRDPDRLGAMETIYTGTNPDLRPFKAAGGKLLLVHGWDDESIIPASTLDYYEQTTRYMGGPAETRDFFRLFMVPGMNHCGGGAGAHAIDYLSILEKWVEKGDAPDHIAALKPKDGVTVPYFGVAMSLKPDEIEFKRAIPAWPAQTRYRGRGDPDDPRNWVTK